VLSAPHRLRRQKDFDRAYKQGQRIFGPIFNLIFLKNDLAVSRFGIVVGKKSEKLATRRNRIKRQLRHLIRANLARIKPGRDIVISIKANALAKTYVEMEKEVYGMLKKAGLLND